MKLRNKFLIALAGLVLLMAAVFFALSEGYTVRLFKQYAATAERGSAQQMATMLAEYYTFNNNSWDGVGVVEQALIATRPGHDSRDESLILVDPQTQKVVFQFPPNQNSSSVENSYQFKQPIVVSGKTVGILYLQDRSTHGLFLMEQTVQHSMSIATIVGTLATALVAVLVGAWLAQRITQPLQTMTTAMKRIEDGDLETRLDIHSKDEFGQVASAFNAMIDRLYQTERARRHLVADVAHELRTPLTIMQGKLELIQQGVEPAEPAQLLPIQDEIVRLTMLVQDLHQLSLAEVGQLPLNKQFTDMNELLSRLVENFSIEAEDHDIQLQFIATGEDAEWAAGSESGKFGYQTGDREASADPGRQELTPDLIANVDPNRIAQVFVNLVGNALRYTPSGGTITVGAKRVGSQLQVRVADTGAGIDEKHLEHIFDRFYRAQEDRSRESGGTGLGLAIAKEFVEAHGGEITVASTVGEGTVFTVILPL